MPVLSGGERGLAAKSKPGGGEMADGMRIAVVTGAGTGIGRAVASSLAGAGFACVLAGRRAAPLEATAGALGGAQTLVVPTDVGDAAAVRALFERAVERFGRVDVLFNNAGIGAPAVPVDELDPAAWDAVVRVNLSGAFYCAREAFRVMRTQDPRGGRIINNGSISAHAPRPFSAPYTATKHAITGLTKALALDGRAFDIACGQIDIGNAATPMTERMAAGVLQPDGATRAEPTMDVGHVGAAVAQMATLPPDANVLFMTVMATTMPFVGRG
jgi:NAD(P)-dependent dehydrogenase (short-subunit alcohol dehydrogenase family)